MPLRVPGDSEWGMRGAKAIAEDPARLQAAAEFWRQAFAGVGIRDPANLSHQAFTLGEHLPDEWFSRLMPSREHLLAGSDDTYLVRRTGCLVSLDEIARSVSSTLTAAELLQCVSALLQIGLPDVVVPPEIAAAALIGTRELFDAAQRFRICQSNSRELGIPTSELLALYRQEGGLCIAPGRNSYRHAPLIRTGFGCRDDAVSLFDTTCSRPGFNLVYSFRHSTDALRADQSLRFDVLFRNLVTLAGMDIVVLPRLQQADELYQLWRMASTVGSGSEHVLRLIATFRQDLAATSTQWFNAAVRKTQRQLFDGFCVGLLRTLAELHDPADSAENLMNLLWLTTASFFAAHPYSPQKPWPGGDVRVSADADASDAYTCLRLQARWYASRKNLLTLLAWNDRSTTRQVLMSPFMTYLRFHSGDAIFVGILLRILARLEFLVKAWESSSSIWGRAFLETLPASGWDPDGVADLRRSLRAHWATAYVNADTAWHHIGLIAKLRLHSDSPPWLKKAQASNPRVLESARIVKRLVDLLLEPHVLNAVSAAIEFTPAFWLASHGFTTTAGPAGTSVLVKSHSFERLRLAYAQAARDGGIE